MHLQMIYDFITNMLSTTPEESNIKLMEYIEEYRDEVIKQEQKYDRERTS